MVDRGYAHRLEELTDNVGDYRARVGKSGVAREMRTGSLAARAGRNQGDMAKLSDVMTVAKQLLAIENQLMSPPASLPERTKLFVTVQANGLIFKRQFCELFKDCVYCLSPK